MKKIDNATKQAIRDKIAEVERHTSSELVCLITLNSARYVFFPLLTAALIALLLPAIELVLQIVDLSPVTLGFHHQTLAFIALSALFVFTPLNLMLTPKWLRLQNCDRHSVEQFFTNRLHDTQGRNAILFFVSWQERYVNVIADRRISEKVDQEIWDALVQTFSRQIKDGQIEAGYLGIIDGLGALLATHFPAETVNENEMPDHLILRDGPGYVS